MDFVPRYIWITRPIHLNECIRHFDKSIKLPTRMRILSQKEVLFIRIFIITNCDKNQVDKANKELVIDKNKQ